MGKTIKNMIYGAGIVLGILVQLVMVLIYGFTSLEIPFFVYAGGWGACIAIIKWASGKIPE